MCFYQEVPHVLKLPHCFQWPLIIPECHHFPHPSLLLRQIPYLPLRSPCTKGRHWVAAVQRRPGHKHVTCRAAGVGAIPFLHNCYHVQHVAVNEVDPEVGTCCCLPLTVPYRAPYEPGRSKEGYTIEPGIRCGQWFHTLRDPILPVLGLAMVSQ